MPIRTAAHKRVVDAVKSGEAEFKALAATPLLGTRFQSRSTSFRFGRQCHGDRWHLTCVTSLSPRSRVRPGDCAQLTRAGITSSPFARNGPTQLSAAISDAARKPSRLPPVRAFRPGEYRRHCQAVRALRKEWDDLRLVNIGSHCDGPGDHAQCQIKHWCALNTLSPIVLSKYVVRFMMADGGGRIVTSRRSSASGYSGLSVYGATKASMLASRARWHGRSGAKGELEWRSPGLPPTE